MIKKYVELPITILEQEITITTGSDAVESTVKDEEFKYMAVSLNKNG